MVMFIQEIYNKYKKYKFNPIDNAIKSTHGCVVSKLSDDEKSNRFSNKDVRSLFAENT